MGNALSAKESLCRVRVRGVLGCGSSTEVRRELGGRERQTEGERSERLDGRVSGGDVEASGGLVRRRE